MKRFLALFLVCCLIVSALSVPAFAADSIVGRKWSCSTTGKTITVGSSDSLSYVFDASLGMNGFGSSPIENIYSSFPGWSGIKRSTSSLYTLPAGSTISYSVTISVSGFSGFGSSDLKPLGHISVCSVTDSGGWQSSVASSSSITPVISSGAYLYSFSGTVTLKDYVKTYAASLFFVFNLTGRTNNPINGKGSLVLSAVLIFLLSISLVLLPPQKTRLTAPSIISTTQLSITTPKSLRKSRMLSAY